MLCRNPYIRDRTGRILVRSKTLGYENTDGLPFPCGQCLPCRINKRRVWTLRLMLELYFHETASFVTLTYSDDNLPFSVEGVPSLCKRDFQLFLKRLRKYYGDKKIRYYGVGEYGSKTHRPHYHIILFGLAPDELDPTFTVYNGKSPRSPLLDLWGFGLVHVGLASRESIQYVAGYVTKKFVNKKTDSMYPEFSLMSRMPGIGSQAVADIAKVLERYQLNGDEGRQLRIDGKKWPLGRYLLEKLKETGAYKPDLDSYIREIKEKWVQAKRSGIDLVQFLVNESEQSFKNMEKKQKLFNHRDVL